MSLGLGFSYDEVFELCQKAVDAKKIRSSLLQVILNKDNKETCLKIIIFSKIPVQTLKDPN